jgi:hypothetical protein
MSTWNLVRTKDNIEVYTRMSDDDKLKEIKINGRIKSSLSEVILALEDVEAQKEWVLRTIDARLLDSHAIGHLIYYVSTDMPFPIQDRDLVVEYIRSQDPKTKVITTISKALPSFIDEAEGFIRIPLFDSKYVLTPKKDGWIEMVYFMQIDPGGALPLWLVNMAVARGPLNSIESLYELIYSKRYKGKSAEGIKELEK